jgi:tetratricopeptide (TPR) repeat protein
VLRIAPLAIPAVLLASGWRQFDRSRFYIADAFSRTVLQSLPPGASLIATDDNILFVLIYLTMVEGVRPDVNLIMEGVGKAQLPPLRFNPDTDPVFFTHHPNWNRPDLDIVPVGLVFQARRAGQALPELTIPLWKLPGEDDAAVPKDDLTRSLLGELHYMLGFSFEQRDWHQAQAQFAFAAAAAPDNDVLFYNLGLIYERNGLLDAARAAFEHSRAINPRHVASGHAFAAERIAALDVERARIAAIERGLAGDPALHGLAPGTPSYRLRLAALLEAGGEARAARGQRLLASEQGADGGP